MPRVPTTVPQTQQNVGGIGITTNVSTPFQSFTVPLLDGGELKGLGDAIQSGVGKIAGGDWASSVPAWCTLDIRAAIYPGVNPRDAAREIEACLQSSSREDPFLSDNPPTVEYNGFFSRGYVLEEGSDAEKVLSQAHAVSFGSSLESFVTPGYLDGRVFVLYDDCPCLVYGPVSKDIHAFDERVSLASVQRITGTIALFIANWCGLEKLR